MKELLCRKCNTKFDTTLLGNIKFCPFCGSELRDNNTPAANMSSSDKYKKFYEMSIDYLNSIKPEDIDITEYFDKKECNNFKDILICFISTLQDYQSMPNIIGFNSKPERKETYNKIFCDYDHMKILDNYDEDSLFNEFCKNFPVNNANSKQNSWRKWARGIIDVCGYLSRFDTPEDFNEHFRSFNGDLEGIVELQDNIYCMGFALSCNVIKDLGFTDYCKPDTHLIDVLSEIGFCSDNPRSVFYKVREIAEANNITPFHLDSIIWLICSGYYYKHDGIKIGSHKKEYIDLLKNELL